MTTHDLLSHNGVTTEVIVSTEEHLRRKNDNNKKIAQEASVRRTRDYMLIEDLDPIVTNPLRWDSLSTDKQNEWKIYRQALLDIPAQSGFPYTVTWPTKPS